MPRRFVLELGHHRRAVVCAHFERMGLVDLDVVALAVGIAAGLLIFPWEIGREERGFLKEAAEVEAAGDGHRIRRLEGTIAVRLAAGKWLRFRYLSDVKFGSMCTINNVIWDEFLVSSLETVLFRYQCQAMVNPDIHGHVLGILINYK